MEGEKMDDSTDVSILHALPVTIPAQQDAYIHALIEAAHRAHKTGWGADGDITGFGEGENVRSQRLWIDPDFPITFTEEDLTQARRTLLMGGQHAPFRVVKLPNPKAAARSFDGVSEQNLLIVDIDGVLLFTAAATTSIDQFRVRVEEYAGSYYMLLIRMLGMKAQQHVLRRVEIGRCYLRIQHTYEVEQHYRKQHNEKPLPLFPTFKELGAQIGINEVELKFCVTMADNPEELIRLAERKQLTEDQLREISGSLPDIQQRIDISLHIAQHNETQGKPISRQDVRKIVQQAKGKKTTPSIEWYETEKEQPMADIARLWGGAQHDLQELPVPVVLGRALHDIEYVISLDGLPAEANDIIVRLRAILHHTEIQVLMRSVHPYQET